jgi:hypothetical protein
MADLFNMNKIKKFAVNITEPCDLNTVHVELLCFLFYGVPGGYADLDKPYKIDYYVCHEGITETWQENKFKNVTVYYSPLQNEQVFLNNIQHDYNKAIISATKNLCKMLFRSEINAMRMHKNIYTDIYDAVINYGSNIKKFRMNTHFRSNQSNSVNSNFIENNLMYTEVIIPMDPYIDYSFYVATQSTFNKIILFRQFVRLMDDWMITNDWWQKWKTDPITALNADGLMLPVWLDMQGIFLRSAYDL